MFNQQASTSNEQTSLPKINTSKIAHSPPSFPPLFSSQNLINNSYLPPINMDQKVVESLRILKQEKIKKLEKKNLEEKVYKALERQTEMLSLISTQFKKKAQKEEEKLLKKIRELERENAEILWQRRNEDMIQERILESKIF